MAQLILKRCTNAPSGNNQVLTLKSGFEFLPAELGIGLTSITFTYSAAPKGDFWKSSATEGSEYIVTVDKMTKG